MKYLILLTILCFVTLTLKAQDEKVDENNKQSIYIKAKSANEGLILRWAPTNYATWMDGNSYGYTVEKLFIDKTDNKLFSPVGPKIFKPWPAEQWKPIVNDSSPYVAAAAMTLFGKSQATNPENFVEASQDNMNRFSFALLSADLDKRAAEASGLYYIDKSIPKNTLVVYRIYILNTKLKTSSDTAYQLVNYGDVIPFVGPNFTNSNAKYH